MTAEIPLKKRFFILKRLKYIKTIDRNINPNPDREVHIFNNPGDISSTPFPSVLYHTNLNIQQSFSIIKGMIFEHLFRFFP